MDEAKERSLTWREEQLMEKQKKFEERMLQQQTAFEKDKRAFEVMQTDAKRDLEAKQRALDEAREQVERLQKAMEQSDAAKMYETEISKLKNQLSNQECSKDCVAKREKQTNEIEDLQGQLRSLQTKNFKDAEEIGKLEANLEIKEKQVQEKQKKISELEALLDE